MLESIRAFLRSVSYTVGSAPLETDTARAIIGAWRADGAPVPPALTAEYLRAYHNNRLRERYPIAWRPLDDTTDRAISSFFREEGYDIDELTDNPPDIIDAWHTLDAWRAAENDPGDHSRPLPDVMTPENLMRWINSRYFDKRKHDTLWLVSFENAEENWRGPFRTLSNGMPCSDGMRYIATDSVRPDAYMVTVPAWHEIRTDADRPPRPVI